VKGGLDRSAIATRPASIKTMKEKTKIAPQLWKERPRKIKVS